ncbi:MAG: polysaccharide biosynthesis tyrosine autokinase [Rhodospirillales bacterium]|nr:polysaccharide biosynthesis tyrosine autokinase [Rhodospirillales bacterium]
MLHVPTEVAGERDGGRERRHRHRGTGARSGDTRSEASAAAAVQLAMTISAVRRRKLPLIVCAVAIPLIAFVALKQVTPRYTSEGSVIYEPSQYAAQELQSILHEDPMTDAVMASQAEIVRSLSVASRLVDRYHLTDVPEFNYTLRPPSLLSRIGHAAQHLLYAVFDPVSPSLAAVFAAPVPKVPPSPQEVRHSVDQAVQDAINVEALRQSHVLSVKFTSENRQLAADAVNTIMDLYITDQLAAKFQAVRSASQWLETRAQELRKEVQGTEDKIAAYKAHTGLFQGVQAGLDTEQISRMTTDLVTAQNELAQAESRLDAARGRQGASAQAAVAPNVVQARVQMDTLNAQLQSLLTRLGPNHPDVVSLRNQLRELQRAVGSEIGRTVAAADNDVRANRAKVAALQADLKAAQLQVDKNNQAMIPLNAMQRDADAARTLLQAVLTRVQTTAQQSAIEKPDARVISEALPPAEPSFPKTKILLPAAVVFGVVFGLLIVYLLELADSTFRSGDDVRAVLGLPCFSLIPAVRPRLLGRIRMEDYVVRKPLSPFSEQIRALRAGLWLDSVHPKIVAITAARPAEAKTTTAMALGRSSAMNGERVLVLDCDVRQPSFGRLMRAEHSRGIVDYLLGQATLDEIVRRDRLTAMDYIPAGTSKANSLGLFMSDAMSEALDRLRRDYDLVLLDAPPVFAMTDARIISRIADATLLCVRWRETPRSVVSRSLDLLDEADARVIGVSLTRVDPRAHVRSGHSDAEVYHPRYGGYYRE